MKNLKYLFILVILASASFSCKKDDVEEVTATDDYTVTVNGNKLKDGDVLETSSVGDEGNMKFAFTNTSSSKIFLRMKIKTITGNPSPEVYQFCFGTCYAFVNESVSYPSYSDIYSVFSLDPNESTDSSLNHIECIEIRSEDFSFDVKLFQCDEQGVELPSKKEINFTFSFVKP